MKLYMVPIMQAALHSNDELHATTVPHFQHRRVTGEVTLVASAVQPCITHGSPFDFMTVGNWKCKVFGISHDIRIHIYHLWILYYNIYIYI